MLREAEVFTLSGEGVHFDRNMQIPRKLYTMRTVAEAGSATTGIGKVKSLN